MLRGWGRPGGASSGRSVQKDIFEEEAEAKPLKAEKEDEGYKCCSKLRYEPGEGSRGQVVR